MKSERVACRFQSPAQLSRLESQCLNPGRSRKKRPCYQRRISKSRTSTICSKHCLTLCIKMIQAFGRSRPASDGLKMASLELHENARYLNGSPSDQIIRRYVQRLEERRKKRRIRDAQEAMRLGVSEEFRRTILLDYVSGKQG